jgi:hypothetical protein
VTDNINDGYYTTDEGCKVCGAMLERVSCWNCCGAGGWHDCGEDCCPCLDKEEITVDCDECDGEGRYWICPDAENHPAPAGSTTP